MKCYSDVLVTDDALTACSQTAIAESYVRGRWLWRSVKHPQLPLPLPLLPSNIKRSSDYIPKHMHTHTRLDPPTPCGGVVLHHLLHVRLTSCRIQKALRAHRYRKHCGQHPHRSSHPSSPSVSARKIASCGI